MTMMPSEPELGSVLKNSAKELIATILPVGRRTCKRTHRSDRVTARAYAIPTDAPEADGTFAWRETTLVVVTIEAGGRTGLGYTYTAGAAASLVTGLLTEALRRAKCL